MAKITLKGNPIHTVGSLPAPGSKAPGFTLTGADLSDVTLDSFKGRRKILSIVPSLDTGVCAMSAKRFNQEVASLKDVVLINISADLPFAQSRFCEAEKLKNIVTLSTVRSPQFGKDYGTLIVDGPLAGIQARAVLVLDAGNKVVHAELVPEIAQEPDYKAALAAVKSL